MLHAKLVSYLQKQDLHSFRLVLNLEHIYLRRSEPGQHFWPRDDAELPRGPSLDDFMKENGFRRLAPQIHVLKGIHKGIHQKESTKRNPQKIQRMEVEDEFGIFVDCIFC